MRGNQKTEQQGENREKRTLREKKSLILWYHIGEHLFCVYMCVNVEEPPEILPRILV